MSNRLGTATSPYLLQHRDNPVHWQEWGDAAFAEARLGPKDMYRLPMCDVSFGKSLPA